MTTQLGLYNEALGLLSERSLASLTEAREPCRVLNDIWARNAVQYCLEQGQWKFALHSVSIAYDPLIVPAFGYKRGFALPADWVRATKICADEFFNAPLLRYVEEAGVIFSDLDLVFVSYVSNGTAYGNNLAAWPETFTRYVACYLAAAACNRVSNDKTLLGYLTGPKGDGGLLHTLLIDARSKSALESPTSFLPSGNWSVARSRGTAGFRDGGSRSNLIG